MSKPLRTLLSIAGIIAPAIFFGTFTNGCDSCEKRIHDSIEIEEDVSGLRITGPRTRANVIANMAPIVHGMQKIYEEHREIKNGLEGRLELQLTVEWTGEIGPIRIRESTFTDRDFEKAVLIPIQNYDFDGWADTGEDTEIVYPITFG